MLVIHRGRPRGRTTRISSSLPPISEKPNIDIFEQIREIRRKSNEDFFKFAEFENESDEHDQDNTETKEVIFLCLLDAFFYKKCSTKDIFAKIFPITILPNLSYKIG